MNRAIICVTAVAAICAQPAAWAKVRGKIIPSEYRREFREQREQAFSNWVPSQDAYSQVMRAEVDNKALLMLERNTNKQARVALYFPKDGKGADTTFEPTVSEQELLEKHAIWSVQGFSILFVRENPVGRTFVAIWIETAAYGDAVKRLNELGVTPAQILLETDEEPPAAAVTSVNTPLRSWTDKAGRTLEASVEGVSEGQVKFVRKDGQKFTYPLADLSDADQRHLQALASQPAVSPGAAQPEGFTKWMTLSEFETLYAENRGKDMYAIYVESNVRGEMRGVFDKRPPSFGWFNAWLETEATLREKNALYTSRGMALLSLSYDRRSKKYSAVWVRSTALEEAKSQLAKQGISLPKIEKDIIVSTVRDS